MIPFCRLRCKNSLRACDMAALLIMTILVLQALIRRSCVGSGGGLLFLQCYTTAASSGTSLRSQRFSGHRISRIFIVSHPTICIRMSVGLRAAPKL